MAVIHPRWSAWTFLVYAGGFTVLGAVGAWLTYFASQSGDAGYAGWALLVLVVVASIALRLAATEHPVAAGVFAFVAVNAFAAFLNALWAWFGWESWSATSSNFGGFHLARLLLELLWLLAAIVAVRTFRFPLLVAQAVLASWILVTDLLSNGGWWSAIVTLFVGLCYLAVAFVVDSGAGRPFGFWLHLGAGILIGGSLLWFWHGGTVEWTLIIITSLIYVFFSQPVGRSSWAVLGAFGLFLASVHFTLDWTHIQFVFFNAGSGSARAWVPPLVLTCLGFVLVALGLALARRSPTVVAVVD